MKRETWQDRAKKTRNTSTLELLRRTGEGKTPLVLSPPRAREILRILEGMDKELRKVEDNYSRLRYPDNTGQ